MKYCLRIATLVVLAISFAGCDPSQQAGARSNASGAQGGSTNSNSWIDTSNVDSSNLDPVRTRKNVYVVYDCSGSMDEKAEGERKYIVARRALRTFVGTLPEEVNLGLIIFDGTIRERVPLGVGNRDTFLREVDQTGPGGGTPLETSITMAYGKLKEQGSRQLGYGEYWLVVVTDGEANSGEDPGSIVKTILSESPVTVYTVGFAIGDRHSLNQPGLTLYKEAKNQKEIEAALKEVTAEADQFTAPTSFGD